MPKRGRREMDVEHSGECSDSAAAGGESSGAAAAGQSTSSGEGQNKNKSLDRLPWRRGVLNVNALTAANMDFLFETDDEDEPVEFQNDSEDEWLPDNDEASDIEDEIVVESPDIEDEDEDEDESRGDIPIIGEKYIAPDLTEWFKKQLPQGNVPSHNVLRKKGGPHRKFRKEMTAKEIFDEFFTTNLKDEILRHSNKKGLDLAADFNRMHHAEIAAQTIKKRDFRVISIDELNAFLGILLVMGVNGQNDDLIPWLWSDCSHPIYKAAMSRDRFQQILRVIRFDNAYTRATRKESDKAAPISDVWEMLMKNLEENYYPDANVTLDEQLFPFRGRAGFIQYIPSKPAKYGIKIFWVCNTADGYPLFGTIYLGRQPGTERQTNVGQNIVLKLVNAYKQSGLNVTTDNFFTSLPLANQLKTRGMSIVGTLRSNKPYIPRELKPNRTDDIGTHRYAFSKDTTLLSVVTKKNKSVYLLSTMHYTRVTNENGKEEMNHYYNKTKGGVDVMDQMLSKYTTKRKTNRWPLALFFNMLDVAALAAFCVFSKLNPEKSKRRSSRRYFLTQLGKDLATANMEKRANDQMVIRKTNYRAALELMLGITIQFVPTVPVPVAENVPVVGPAAPEPEMKTKDGRKVAKGRCYICIFNDPKSDRKGRTKCSNCKRTMCATHTKSLPPLCTGPNC